MTDPSGESSNVVSLRHYTERLFAEHRREHELIAEATRVALTTLNGRMEGINEFRGQLRDQAGTFVTRDMFAALVERLSRVENARARSEGQMAVLIGIASLGSAIATALVSRMIFGGGP